MTKAINWPEEYLEEVKSENTADIKIALRLGSLYYDHCYYVPDEVIDVRVNHKIIRPGVVVGEMKLCQLKDLTPEDLAKQKHDLKTIDALIKCLAKTYDQEVTPETKVTVIYYRNLSSEEAADRLDDPHMS